jgi:hypothetical protein
MSITLLELLMLVGRLDDEPGFDTARERYRRFLLEHVSTIPIYRAFVDQCQHALDEQQHRALQDLVVLLGRFLGLETKFGSYGPGTGSCEGLWRSRGRLDVHLDVRTAQTGGADLENLSRRLIAPASGGTSARSIGLCVTLPLYPNRSRLDETLAAGSHPTVRIASLRSLIELAVMVDAGSIGHQDVVNLLDTSNGLDFVIGLIQRVAPAPCTDTHTSAQSREADPGFWLATVTGDPAIDPEQFLERVIGRRQIFGVSGTLDGAASPGDWICFYIPEKGVVGRAQVGWIVTERSGLRDAHQYCQMFRLDKVDLHVNAPIHPDFEAQLRLRAARATIGPAPSLLRISQRDFVALTTSEAERIRGADDAAVVAVPDDALAISAGDQRSRA